MQNIIVAIVMVLQILISGGNANGSQNNMNNMSWLQLMALMGNNNVSTNWYQDSWKEIDQTIDLGDGQWQQYGYGKGSSVRIHGNLNTGMYFDFSIKGNQWDSQRQVTSPVEGITITQTSYNSGDSGYTFSVGPVTFQTALNLWNMATSQMAS